MSFSPGWEYDVTIHWQLEIKDGLVTGSSLWKLVQYPESGQDYGSGKTATEKLSGTYDTSQRFFDLKGGSRDDPDGVLHHSFPLQLTLSEDGCKLTPLNNWGGFFEARRGAVPHEAREALLLCRRGYLVPSYPSHMSR